MPGELAALGTGVLAHITFVRLLSRVRSDMNGQVGSVLEHFPTIFTGVIPLDILQSFNASLPGDLPHEARLHGRQRGHRLANKVLYGLK